MEPVITVRKVNHYYGSGKLRRQILHDLSADILSGEIVILTGPSGSGKTTFLTLIGALRSIEEGSLRTLNQELRGAGAETMIRVRMQIGFIFQSHNLLDSLSARQNVQTSLALDAAVSTREARQRSVDALASVGLADYAEAFPSQLSGGQRQRVAIARALVRRPKIVLADEPTAALDKKSGREAVELLHNLAKRQGCAILLVTHDNRILDIADRILTLEDGRISSYASGLAANTGHLFKAFVQLHRRGELARHVQGLSDQEFIRLLHDLTAEFDEALNTLDFIQHEASQTALDVVVEAVALRIRELLAADRVTLYLVDEPNGLLRSKVAEHDGAEPLHIQIPIHTGVAGRVAMTGESLNIADPYNHPDFYRQIDEQTGFRTGSMLCMPVYDRRGKVFAVAQVLNREGGRLFTEEDELKFREFTAPLGVILDSCSRFAGTSGEGLR